MIAQNGTLIDVGGDFRRGINLQASRQLRAAHLWALGLNFQPFLLAIQLVNPKSENSSVYRLRRLLQGNGIFASREGRARDQLIGRLTVGTYLNGNSYFTPDGAVRVEVVFEGETFWLTQRRMADLFAVGVPTISCLLYTSRCV